MPSSIYNQTRLLQTPYYSATSGQPTFLKDSSGHLVDDFFVLHEEGFGAFLGIYTNSTKYLNDIELELRITHSTGRQSVGIQSVALNNNKVALIGLDHLSKLSAQVYDNTAESQRWSSKMQVVDTAYPIYLYRIAALNDGGFVVAWYDETPSHPALKYKVYGPDYVSSDAVEILNDNSIDEFTLASLSNNLFVVGWYTRNNTTQNIQVFAADGTPIQNEVKTILYCISTNFLASDSNHFIAYCHDTRYEAPGGQDYIYYTVGTLPYNSTEKVIYSTMQTISGYNHLMSIKNGCFALLYASGNFPVAPNISSEIKIALINNAGKQVGIDGEKSLSSYMVDTGYALFSFVSLTNGNFMIGFSLAFTNPSQSIVILDTNFEVVQKITNISLFNDNGSIVNSSKEIIIYNEMGQLSFYSFSGPTSPIAVECTSEICSYDSNHFPTSQYWQANLDLQVGAKVQGDICLPPLELFGQWTIPADYVLYIAYATSAYSIISTIGWGITSCMFKAYKARYTMDPQVNDVPIGVALEKDKDVELIPFNSSTTKFKYDGITSVKTSWISGKDAILAYDHDGSECVHDGSKIVLTRWSPSSTSDFDALLKAFDSNGDKVFDANDGAFSKFGLWQDKNENGICEDGEFMSLQSAGVSSIDFSDEAESETLGVRTAKIHWTDGRITNAYDLTFAHETSAAAETVEI